MKSHQNVFISIMRQLAERGHRITYISNIRVAELNDHPRIRQVILDGIFISDITFDFFDWVFDRKNKLMMMLDIRDKMATFPSKVAKIVYANPEVQDLISNNRYDLVFVSQFFGLISYPLVWHFNAKLIIVSPNSLLPGLAGILGDSDHPEYVPYVYGWFPDRMNFVQRTLNTMALSSHASGWIDWHLSPVRKIARQVLPDCAPLDEIEKNFTSLVFVNSHPVFNYPRALPLQVIEVAGTHCRPAKALPNVLNVFR